MAQSVSRNLAKKYQIEFLGLKGPLVMPIQIGLNLIMYLYWTYMKFAAPKGQE